MKPPSCLLPHCLRPSQAQSRAFRLTAPKTAEGVAASTKSSELRSFISKPSAQSSPASLKVPKRKDIAPIGRLAPIYAMVTSRTGPQNYWTANAETVRPIANLSSREKGETDRLPAGRAESSYLATSTAPPTQPLTRQRKPRRDHRPARSTLPAGLTRE